MNADPRIKKLQRLIDRSGTAGEGLAAKAALQRIVARLPVIGRVIEHRPSCGQCGSAKFIVEEGRGPHAFHLRCATCKRGGSWMSHAVAQQLEEEHAASWRRP
jgi:hypothetical protein